ncbi:MAG: CocE/NonD family hydrolase [Terriglobia bacterium]
MKKSLGLALAIAAGIALAVAGARSQPYRVIIQHNVPVIMRDGTVLRADVYTPDGPGPFPVLLTRTPYNKDSGENMDVAYRGAELGFIMVNQDVRGRYASAGEWYPFRHEASDGYDTVEWCAALPHSDGKVGMWGGSYDGATQLFAAVADPPHLGGIFPMCTTSNFYKDWTYQDGAFTQWFDESWATELAPDTLLRLSRIATNPMDYIRTEPLKDYALLSVPAANGLTQAIAPYFEDWLRHSTYDAYWKQWAFDRDYSRIHVPVYSMGGWYDLFLGGTLANYEGIKVHGGTPAARSGARLLIIPGGHAGWHRRVGDVDFGSMSNVDYYGVMLRWYAWLLKGAHNGVGREKPVKYFVMGKRAWAEADTWPPPGAHTTAFYLHSEGKANAAHGDGALSVNPPGKEPPDHFVYNPSDPVPTIGGKLCCDGRHLEAGARDQGPDEARDDVMVYSTPVFTHDLDVTGPVKLVLYASSSAVDTDFVATLVDVDPGGFARNVTDGIVRARYRNSLQNPKLIKPGHVYKFTIDLWATSNVFLAGHRLRIDISSSNFPRFDRNLNTAESPETGDRWVKATNTIYHDAAHPSAVLLPVMQQE